MSLALYLSRVRSSDLLGSAYLRSLRIITDNMKCAVAGIDSSQGRDWIDL